MEIKVVLVEAQDSVRGGVLSVLKGEPKLKVLSSTTNGHDVINSITDNNVNLVIVDLSTPGINAVEYTSNFKKHDGLIKVLLLATYDHEFDLLELLDAGADGYILKSSTKEELMFAINKVVNDGIYIGPEFTLNLLTKKRLERSIEKAQAKQNNTLSEREMDVLRLIAKGMTNAEMANKLHISVRTIETRRKKILEKTGTKNTATLIRFALLNHWIE